jgi:hypothetical protein
MIRSRLRFGQVSAAILALALFAGAPNVARADEGGLSFWLPGLFGSLAAVPGTPGLSWTTIYYHTNVSAQAGQVFQLGGLRGSSIVAGLQGQGDLPFFGPTYTFETPVLGGQASLSVFGVGGRNEAFIAATLTGPLGRTISGSLDQSLTSVGDVIPQGSLKWNAGVNNFMIYGTGDVPVGDYNAARIANLGIGHGALDGGAGYTYFNPQTGHEFSAVVGATYNFENVHTQYQNGVDLHLDWGASQFLTQQLQVGLVGYGLQQVSCDSGTGSLLGCNETRVFGIGPQLGFIIPMGSFQGYINFKGYKEFAAENRAAGWNTWLTFAISPAPPSPTPQQPLVMKY